ncbi:MAG: hypothetical protein ABI240_12475 [Sphingomonas sp.]
MNDVELILELLEVRARHLSASAFMYSSVHELDNYTDTPSAPARIDLYDAQAAVLCDFAAEIRAGMATNAATTEGPIEQRSEARYLFIQEMGGTMTATAHTSWEECKARDARYEAEHEAYFENCSNGVSHKVVVNITPKKLASASGAAADLVLDVRWVLITDVDSLFRAEIYDTEEELRRAEDAFKSEYEDWIESDDAVWTSHKILIPPMS